MTTPNMPYIGIVLLLLAIWMSMTLGVLTIKPKLEDILLELQRVNTNLENIYLEMPWSEETYNTYCTEHPDMCEEPA